MRQCGCPLCGRWAGLRPATLIGYRLPCSRFECWVVDRLADKQACCTTIQGKAAIERVERGRMFASGWKGVHQFGAMIVSWCKSVQGGGHGEDGFLDSAHQQYHRHSCGCMQRNAALSLSVCLQALMLRLRDSKPAVRRAAVAVLAPAFRSLAATLAAGERVG
jgi:hypothetical protein